MNPIPSSEETPPKTICAPCMVNNMQRNIDQIAANVALGYPPIVFCFTETAIETIHCINPKNCIGGRESDQVKGKEESAIRGGDI